MPALPPLLRFDQASPLMPRYIISGPAPLAISVADWAIHHMNSRRRVTKQQMLLTKNGSIAAFIAPLQRMLGHSCMKWRNRSAPLTVCLEYRRKHMPRISLYVIRLCQRFLCQKSNHTESSNVNPRNEQRKFPIATIHTYSAMQRSKSTAPIVTLIFPLENKVLMLLFSLGFTYQLITRLSR